MSERLDPQSIDLAAMVRVVRARCFPALPGEIMGRTLIRDGLVAQLACSELEAELLVDTVIARGFVNRGEQADGLVVREV